MAGNIVAIKGRGAVPSALKGMYTLVTLSGLRGLKVVASVIKGVVATGGIRGDIDSDSRRGSDART